MTVKILKIKHVFNGHPMSSEYAFAVPDDDFDIVDALEGVLRDYLNTEDGEEAFSGKMFIRMADVMDVIGDIPKEIFEEHGFKYLKDVFEVECSEEASLLML